MVNRPGPRHGSQAEVGVEVRAGLNASERSVQLCHHQRVNHKLSMSTYDKKIDILKNTRRVLLEDVPMINLCAYFSGPVENMHELIAKTLEVLANYWDDHAFEFTLHHADASNADVPEKLRLRLANADQRNALRNRREGLEFAGGGVLGRWDLYAQNQHYTGHPRSMSTYLQLGVYLDVDLAEACEVGAWNVELRQRETGWDRAMWLKLCRDIFVSVDGHGGCYYGFVDADIAAFVHSGIYYGTAAGCDSMWKYQVNRVDWATDVLSRVHRVRMPTWMTFLGPGLASKLDGVSRNTVSEYLEQSVDSSDVFAMRTVSGAMLFAACEHPLDTVLVPPDNMESTSVRNASWLWKRFRAASIV